jgi:phenylacetate-coenzyme A ligase PaaK-like adenylate-forming protein
MTLVDALNDWSPQVIASYPTTLLLLAAERDAGRLRVAPRRWCGAVAKRWPMRNAPKSSGRSSCQVINGYGSPRSACRSRSTAATARCT